MAHPPRADCYQKAIQLLARRPHFRQELASKLLAKGFDGGEVETAVARLSADGYLDDHEHALQVASGPMQRKGYGPRRIRAELEGKGVESVLVSSVLDRVFPDRASEVEAATRAIERWRPFREVDRAKAGRHLERKGYSTAVILQVLDGIGAR